MNAGAEGSAERVKAVYRLQDIYLQDVSINSPDDVLELYRKERKNLKAATTPGVRFAIHQRLALIVKAAPKNAFCDFFIKKYVPYKMARRR